MAEGTAAVCQYYLHSYCRNGNRCRFLHENPMRYNDVESEMCRFYLNGWCKYGNNCRFSHNPRRNDRHYRSRSENVLYQSSENLYERRNQDKNKQYRKNVYYSNAHNSRGKSPARRRAPFIPNQNPESAPTNSQSYVANNSSSSVSHKKSKPQVINVEMCSHFINGACPHNDRCFHIHGDLCEFCGKNCLNPIDEAQRKTHTESCAKKSLQAAIQRSSDKTCGICMDVIMEKDPVAERVFGILEKCNHVFCLACIRKWRRVKTFDGAQYADYIIDPPTMADPAVTRGCPECRAISDFVTPSQYWVDTEKEKTKLISDYKESMSKKHCRFFKRGKGWCPFAGACFYLHAKPDGTKVKLPLRPARDSTRGRDRDLARLEELELWRRREYWESVERHFVNLDLNEFIFMLSGSDSDSDSDSDFEDFFF